LACILQHRSAHAPVRVIPSRLIRFWPWLVASAAIHGLLLVFWLNDHDSHVVANLTDDVVIELEGMDANPEKPEVQPRPSVVPLRNRAIPQAIHKPIYKKPIHIQAAMASAVAATSKKTAPLIARSTSDIHVIPARSKVTRTQLAHHMQTSPRQVAHISEPRHIVSQRQPDPYKTRVLIRKHLEAFKYYPASARRRGIEGRVEVGFTLTQDGAANQVSVLHGSGYAVLDHAALETVYRAQPFPVEDGKYRFSLRFKRL